MTKEWTQVAKNFVIEGDGFMISYLPPLTELTISSWNADGMKAETALLNRETEVYYILNGDWRKEYEEVFDKGYDACYEFYLSKKDEFRSSWSED